MCILAASSIQFFLNVTSLLNLEIWAKLNIQLKQFISATPLKPLNRILINFVVLKDKLYSCANSLEMLIQFFFLELLAF